MPNKRAISDSSDDDSSDSSHEFLVPPNKINLDSTFFANAAPKANLTASTADNSSDDYDDDFDDESDKTSSADLIAQVLRNLENANKLNSPQSPEKHCRGVEDVTSKRAKTKTEDQDLSTEIEDLLRQGESGAVASTSGRQDASEDDAEEVPKPPPGYSIPKEGVNVTLPGNELMLFHRNKKKKQDLETLLKNRLNKQLRTNQVLVHKAGLLCWLHHGFYLNRQVNDPEVLSVALSLVSSNSYPKGRTDLTYLEQVTKWFKKMFDRKDKGEEEGITKEKLLARFNKKEVDNYKELVLLYVATLRAIGLNCRLVLSLCAPPLKVHKDRLIGENGEKKKIVKEESSSEAPKTKAKAAAASSKNIKGKTSDKKSSDAKEVPINSTAGRKCANEEAKKKAAAVLKGKFRDDNDSFSEGSKAVPKKTMKLRSKASDSKTVTAAIPKGTSERSDYDSDDEESQAKASDGTVIAAKLSKFAFQKEKAKKIDDEDSEDDEKMLPKASTRIKSNTLASKLSKNAGQKDKSKKIDDEDSEDEKKVPKTSPILSRLRSRTLAAKLSRNVTQKEKLKKANDDDSEDDEKILPQRSSRLKLKAIAAKPSQNAIKKGKLKDANDDDSEDEKDVLSKRTATLRPKASAPKPSEKAALIGKSKDSDYEDSEDEYLPGKSSKKASVEELSTSSEDEDESDSEPAPKPTLKRKSTNRKSVSGVKAKTEIDRKLLSSDDDYKLDVKPKKTQDVWAEVYVESEESWISVSVPDDKIHCTTEIYKKASDPVLYVIAWNSSGALKDVTRRYAPHWLTVTRKQRIDEKWWSEALSPWKEKETALTKAEDEMLQQKELEQPLPTTVGNCKGHPLYVLARHLLKFEGLYPPDCLPLGTLKTGEAVYSRHCVHTLCSRETWVKKARVVKPGEKAYKVVKARPKYDKLSGARLKDEALELFGKWQTDQYIPPVAKDGIVPRNEYGNVDLFKQCMLPTGTVHIRLPALNRVARKLDIDCCPAVVGFNFGGKGALPAFDGFVVCEEFEDILREAWEEEQVEAKKRAKEKYEKRVYGNWRRLIRALYIRERLTAKYDFNAETEEPELPNKPNPKKGGGKKPKTSSK